MANADARQELIDQLTIKVLSQEFVSKAKATKVVDSLFAAVEEGGAKAVKPIVFKTILVCAGIAALPLIAVMMERRERKRAMKPERQPARVPVTA